MRVDGRSQTIAPICGCEKCGIVGRLINSLAEGRTETPQTRKMPAPTGPGGGRIAMKKGHQARSKKAQTPNFADHYWSRCGEARFVFGWLLYFG